MNLDKFTSNGKFLMLALDHRGSFKKMMNPSDPESISDDQIISLKNDIIEALQIQFSGLLIDEVWGLEACHEVCQIKPFLLPLEKSGYTDQAGEKITELEYSVGQIKKMGASGAKLLIYFSPSVESAKQQLETARQVLEQCKVNNLPFFLEIVTYVLASQISRNPQVSIQTHPKGVLVIESVRTFKEMGIIPDVWKLEYPGDLESCMELTNLVGDTPWILLTGGGDFNTFRGNLAVAIKAGARGFLAGRALWQEVCIMQREQKQQFLKETLPERFKILNDQMNI